MSKERVDELLSRNANYARTHKPSPHLAEVRGVVQDQGMIAILSCSDPRVIPEEFLDLQRLEASVIRTAGGRSIDCMRSLQALDVVGNLGAVVVIHHTEADWKDCGGLAISDEDIYQRMLERDPEEARKVGRIDFGTFASIGLEESIRRDVELVKKSPFLRKDLYVAGYAFDIDTGLLTQVA